MRGPKLTSIKLSDCPRGSALRVIGNLGYYASVLIEYQGGYPAVTAGDKVIGIDLDIKDFAITYDGEKVSKYLNLKHACKLEKWKNLSDRASAAASRSRSQSPPASSPRGNSHFLQNTERHSSNCYYVSHVTCCQTNHCVLYFCGLPMDSIHRS